MMMMRTLHPSHPAQRGTAPRRPNRPRLSPDRHPPTHPPTIVTFPAQLLPLSPPPQKQLGDTNICTACGVWYAIGQAPPAECPAPAPTSFFQHVHQALWFVPPFYRYLLIYAAMLIAFPFVLLASYLGLV